MYLKTNESAKYLNHIQVALAFLQLPAAVASHKGNDAVVYAFWYKLLPRTRLPTPAVQYIHYIYLIVSDGVDNGVDAAVGKNHDDGEVVESAGEVDVRVAEVVHQVVRLVPRPTEDEEQRDGGQRLDHISTSAHNVVVMRLQT